MFEKKVWFGSIGVSHTYYPQTARQPLVLLQATDDGNQSRVSMTADQATELVKDLKLQIAWAKKAKKKLKKRRN